MLTNISRKKRKVSIQNLCAYVASGCLRIQTVQRQQQQQQQQQQRQQQEDFSRQRRSIAGHHKNCSSELKKKCIHVKSGNFNRKFCVMVKVKICSSLD